MSRMLALTFVAILMLGSTACYTAPVVPPVAGVFTNTQAPLDIDLEETQLGSKTGKASASNILGLFAWGNASIARAAQDGGIQTIRHADYEYLNVLGIYQRFTTVARGD